jgi:Flp pilus assembly protein protease CpaA
MTQNIEAALAPHPHRMELWGNASGVRFPPLCANCGSPAQNRLTYKKQFICPSGDSEVPDTVVDTLVRVPFCDPCIAKHKAEGPGPSLLANIKALLHSGASLLGTVGFGTAAAVAGFFALHNMGQGDPQLFRWLASATGFMLLLTWAMYSTLRGGTEMMRTEWQNSITQAFDFSDSKATPHRGATFVCTMRNQGFASAFRELNQSLEFDPAMPVGPATHTPTKRRFWLALCVISVLALLAQLFIAGKG